MDVDEVELPEAEIVDLRVDGLIKCAQWTSDNYEYVVKTLLTERFFYKFEETSILVRDLFTGDLRTFIPAESFPSVRFENLWQITNNCLFVIYQIDIGPNIFEFQIGIIAFDYSTGTYNFVCKPHPIFNHHYLEESWCFHFYSAGENLIGTRLEYMASRITDPKCEKEQEKVYLWSVNQNASNFELQTVINIDKNGRWLGIIDSTAFYKMEFGDAQERGFGVYHIVKVDANTPSAVLENSSIYFEHYPKVKRKIGQELTYSLLENWYSDNLFVLSSGTMRVDGIRTMSEYLLYSFNVRECRWTKAFLNIPPLKRSMFFYVVVDGIMTIFDQNKDRNTKNSVRTYRLPLEKPDKLFNITRFKVQEHKLGTSIPIVKKILTEF